MKIFAHRLPFINKRFCYVASVEANMPPKICLILLFKCALVLASYNGKPPAKFNIHANNAMGDNVYAFDSGDVDYYDNFMPHCKTVFLVHGWYPHHFNAFEESVMFLLASRNCCNVVNVEWRSNSDGAISYYEAAARVPAIAAHLADHIIELHRFGVLQHRVEIIAHSMGCHIAGTAARITNRNGRRIDAVIGLEPPGPGFTDYDTRFAKYRLTKNDATKVITLFTNKNYLGSSRPIGDYVFFANDGDNQPGCELNIMCDHLKAIEYFNESLKHRKYVAYDKRGNEADFQSLKHDTVPGHYYFSTTHSFGKPEPHDRPVYNAPGPTAGRDKPKYWQKLGSSSMMDDDDDDSSESINTDYNYNYKFNNFI